MMNTDIMALESSPGEYVKLVSSTSPEKFSESVQRRVPRDVSGHLMSMVVWNKGVENTPIALLANHVKEELFKMHGEASKDCVPGIAWGGLKRLYTRYSMGRPQKTSYQV
jgi:hypothetical protein